MQVILGNSIQSGETLVGAAYWLLLVFRKTQDLRSRT